LLVEIGDARKEFNLRNDIGQVPKWFYFTANLTSGNTPLKISSNNQTSLSKMIIYSDSYENETVNELFAPKGVPATMLQFNAVDPTHYVAKVNATIPFVLRLNENDKRIASNPLPWVANINGNQYHSVSLYQDGTAFFIPETGELEVKVEYVPQKWFYLGLVVTIITIIGSLAYLMWQRRERLLYSFKTFSEKVIMITYHFLIIMSPNNQAKVSKYFNNTKRLRNSSSVRDMNAEILQRQKQITSDIEQEEARQKQEKHGFLHIRTIVKPQLPIFIALLLLIYVPILLVPENNITSIRGTVTANQIMIYVYVLLVIGAVWQYVKCIH
jgi:hypothetical protein